MSETSKNFIHPQTEISSPSPNKSKRDVLLFHLWALAEDCQRPQAKTHCHLVAKTETSV